MSAAAYDIFYGGWDIIEDILIPPGIFLNLFNFMSKPRAAWGVEGGKCVSKSKIWIFLKTINFE